MTIALAADSGFSNSRMSTYHEAIEFRTLDGLTIRGSLYPATKRGPAVVMTPGVSEVHILWHIQIHKPYFLHLFQPNIFGNLNTL